MNTNIRQLPIETVIAQISTEYPALHDEFEGLLLKLDDLSNNQRRLIASYLRIQTSRINPTRNK